jgi:hypothetical protein
MSDTISDTIQAPETAPEASSIDVSATKSAKGGDKVVASVPLPRQRATHRRLNGQRIPEPVWAEAMRRYVSAELPSLDHVARHLGCHRSAVARRAAAGDWRRLRREHGQRIETTVRDMGPMVGSRTVVGDTALATAQTAIGTALMAHAQTVLPQLSQLMSGISDAAARLSSAGTETDTDRLARRLTALSSAHAQTIDSLRVLAGLPHPDKAPRPKPSKAQQSHQDSPRTARKGGMLGLDPGNQSTGIGGKEEGGGGMGGPVVAMPPPPPQSEGGAVSGGGPFPERAVSAQTTGSVPAPTPGLAMQSHWSGQVPSVPR